MLESTLQGELHPTLQPGQGIEEVVLVRGQEFLDDAQLLDNGREPHRQDGRHCGDGVHHRLVGHQVVSRAEQPVDRAVTDDRGDPAVHDRRHPPGWAEPDHVVGDLDVRPATRP